VDYLPPHRSNGLVAAFHQKPHLSARCDLLSRLYSGRSKVAPKVDRRCRQHLISGWGTCSHAPGDGDAAERVTLAAYEVIANVAGWARGGGSAAAAFETTSPSALAALVPPSGRDLRGGPVRMTWRKGAALAGVAAMASGLGAWLGSPNKASKPPASTIQVSHPASSKAPVGTGWAGLVPRASCDDTGRITVTGYDPSTWKVAASAVFPSPGAVGARMGDGTSIDVAGTLAGTLCPASAGPPSVGSLYVAAQLFSPDFSQMAVQIIVPGGGHHVGVMNRSGAVTDLTTLGGQIGANESEPLFSADGKSIVFALDNAPAGSPTVFERAVPGGARSNVAVAGQVQLAELAADKVLVPNPYAPVAALLDQTGAGTLQVWHLPTTGAVAGHGRLGLLHHVAGQAAEPWQLAACAPLAWVNATTLLCMGIGSGLDLGAPSSGDFWTVRVDASGASSDAPAGEELAPAVSAALLPAGDKTTFYGAGVLVGSTLYAPQIVGGVSHVLSAPVAGGTAVPVPAADAAFASPGYFLPAANGGARG